MLYIYLTFDENLLTNGIQVLPTELTPIPDNMKLQAVVTCNPFPETDAGRMSYVNGISETIRNWSEKIMTSKWDPIIGTTVRFIPPSRILTKFAFWSRFTFEENVAIETAAQSNIPIKVLKDSFQIAESINLDEPTIDMGLDLLVSAEIITPERKLEIIA